MKKSSIIVTFLLVIAIVFAVSCPNNKKTVSVKDDVTANATVGEAQEITFLLETNGEFTDKIKEAGAIVGNASAFDNDNDKAILKFVSAELNDKRTEATVKMSLLAKKATTGNLTFEIKAVENDADAIVKDTKEKITVGGKSVQVTVTLHSAKISKIALGDNEVSSANPIRIGQGKTQDIKITLTGATFVENTSGSKEVDNTKISIADSSTLGISITKVLIDDTDSHLATVTVSATSDAAMIESAVTKTLTIDSSVIKVDEGYAVANLSFDTYVKVDYSVKVEVTLTDGATWSFKQGQTFTNTEYETTYKITVKISNADMGNFLANSETNYYYVLGESISGTQIDEKTVEIKFVHKISASATVGEKKLQLTLKPGAFSYDGFPNTYHETEDIIVDLVTITINAKDQG